MASEKTTDKAESSGIMPGMLELIQTHRKKIFIGLIVIIMAFVIAIVIITVRDNLHESGLVRVDELERRYADLYSYDEYGLSDADRIFRMAELNILLNEVVDFQRNAFGFASARAYVLAGDIHWETGDYEQAENAWLGAARAARNSYLEPVSYFNAAIAAEEQGNIDNAIAHYERVLAAGDNFPAAARAQFAIGRLEESRGNTVAALLAYENLLFRWFNDPVWASLAQSRIVALSN